MLLGIVAGSVQMALLAIAGNIVGNITAYAAKFNRRDIENGIYGFNGTLVGIATGVFFQMSIPAILLLIAASALSTFIARLISMQKFLPGLTAPFVIATWAMIAIAPDSMLLQSTNTTQQANLDWLDSLSFSFGQVMFQATTITTGILFFTAIAVNSRTNALYALLGAVISIITAIIIGIDTTAINMGLAGYNGILCAIAIGKRSLGSAILVAMASILSVALQYAGIHLGITTLTAPFVAATWIALMLQKLGKQKSGQG